MRRIPSDSSLDIVDHVADVDRGFHDARPCLNASNFLSICRCEVKLANPAHSSAKALNRSHAPNEPRS
jgi:hypothetical protein